MRIATTRRVLVFGTVLAPFVSRGALAQAFPSRPIRIVIGFPAGGGIDILARLMAPKMSERLGQPVIVENRPGANGQIATQGVAQSEPDGHTILFGTTGNLAVNPVLYVGRPGMNMERDFTPLSHGASLAFVLVVNPSVEAKSVAELIALAKSKPGTDLRLRRAGQPAASVRRAVRELHRNQPHAYPVQGRRTGAHRRAGGPDRHGIRDPA